MVEKYNTTEEESLLIEHCIAGDHSSQKVLYLKYYLAMYNIAYRILNNQPDAEEVLQDTFLDVFKSLSSFRQESTLGAWIKRIMIRKAMKYLKKSVKFEELPTVESNTSIDWANVNLNLDDLNREIQNLPVGYRAVFVLIEIEGLSLKEPSEELNLSLGTVKSQLFNAKRYLQKRLGFKKKTDDREQS